MPTFHNQFQPRATRTTVYQLRADVLCPDGMENAFSRIIGLVLPFVAKSLYTKLPSFTPQMNARMENFIRAIKTECLDKIIFTSEAQLRIAVKEYLEYWNHYRPHAGLGGSMVMPYPQDMENGIWGCLNESVKNTVSIPIFVCSFRSFPECL